VVGKPEVGRHLVWYVLLKLVQNPFMCAYEVLLMRITRFWDLDEECFEILGKCLELALLDIYFMIGFPFREEVGDSWPKLGGGRTLEELIKSHCE
jgi:hypothetical protein